MSAGPERKRRGGGWSRGGGETAKLLCCFTATSTPSAELKLFSFIFTSPLKRKRNCFCLLFKKIIRGKLVWEMITDIITHVQKNAQSAWTLLYKESQAGSVRHSLCMEEDWIYNSPFLFILIFCRVLQFWLLFLCILIIN